ncbi:LysE/ArgO family amino acid transporter [Vibrio mimicus]|uniref:LysE/ArgO family amino acid transporter n=1 Tax=Vibrio mimicus TaxID=674 RepID=UPI0011D748C3|nr:LysE/ArgO family amino acid transporter [Vibrio mimicus]TXY15268.1 amino acid transporter [Vibrio mimicus]
MNWWILLQGFSLGATMIIPIGAQNAYVLNQGIKRHHHLTTAVTCGVLDMFFITLGIFGGGALISQNTSLLIGVTLGGILFLCAYGFLSLRAALKPAQASESVSNPVSAGRKAVIFGAFAVTVFNPHLYLDTVVILGSIGGQFQGDERIAFAIGTILASFVWFFTLSLGAAKLSTTLSKPRVRQVIDMAVAAMMFIIAFALTKNLYLTHWAA